MAAAARRGPSPFGLLRNPIRFFGELETSQGPISRIQFGKQSFYLVHAPDAIQDFLVTQSARFEKFPQVAPSKGLFGRGLLTSEEPLHMRQRRLMQPAFHRDRLQCYAEQMVASTERVMSAWQPGAELDASGAMNRLALDIVSRTLFSTEADHRAAEIASELDVVLHMLNRLVMPWGNLWIRLPLPSTLRYKRALGRLDAIIHGFIEQRHRSAAPHADLLAMLLAGRDPESGAGMDDVQIRDELMTIFVAGHDTTANGLTWTLYLLARNPGIQAKLAALVEATLGDRPAAFGDLTALRPVEHAFAEAMRLFPPVWILGRKVLQPYVFGDFEAAPGSVLLVCMAVLHRNARFFPDPDSFKPERWESPCWPRHAYLPFGAGSRMCIGERFAWMEGVLCLATMLQKYRFELMDQKPPVPLGLLTLRPRDGLRLRIFPVDRTGATPAYER